MNQPIVTVTVAPATAGDICAISAARRGPVAVFDGRHRGADPAVGIERRLGGMRSVSRTDRAERLE